MRFGGICSDASLEGAQLGGTGGAVVAVDVLLALASASSASTGCLAAAAPADEDAALSTAADAEEGDATWGRDCIQQRQEPET